MSYCCFFIMIKGQLSVKKKRPQDAQPHQRCVMGDLGFSPTSRNRAIFSEEKTARFAERVPHGIACHFLKEGCLFPGIAFFTTPKEGLPFFATTRSALFRYGKHHWILPDGHRRKITDFAQDEKRQEKQRLLGGSTAYDGLFREKKQPESVGSYSNKATRH